MEHGVLGEPLTLPERPLPLALHFRLKENRSNMPVSSTFIKFHSAHFDIF